MKQQHLQQVDQYLTDRDNPKSLTQAKGSNVRLLTLEETKQGQSVYFGSLFDKNDKFIQVVWVPVDSVK